MSEKKSTVFMFSGQGSHYFQMGKDLFDHNKTFRESMQRMDKIVVDLTGASVIDDLYDPNHSKGMKCDRITLTHPAIFMVEYAMACTLMESGIMPSMTLGVSLGSFAAAAVAGFVNADPLLVAIVKQAQILEERCPKGGMLAILDDPSLFSEPFIRERAELAATNFSTHFVVSSDDAGLVEIENELRKRNITHQRLQVAYAFHSRWMDSVREAIASATVSLNINPGRMPLFCCQAAQTMSQLDDGYFWRVGREPIRFKESIESLERVGDRQYQYIDVGPAGTLATFLKYGLPKQSKSTIHAVMTPFGKDMQNLTSLQVGAAA